MLEWIRQAWRKRCGGHDEVARLAEDFDVVLYRNLEAQDVLKNALLETLHARLTPEDRAKVTAEEMEMHDESG